MTALDVFCRTCGAQPGEACVSVQKRLPRLSPHRQRARFAERMTAATTTYTPPRRKRNRSERARDHARKMAELRPLVFVRAGYRCEARVDGWCNGTADHAHHVLPRSGGGTDTLENLVAVCGPNVETGRAGCHAWIHAHAAEARERGLLRSRYGRRIA